MMQDEYKWRLPIVISVLLILFLGLISRIIYLGIIKHSFLLDQGNVRSVREVSIPAYRGMIMDRNGEPLAISVDVSSVWVNPQSFDINNENIEKLSELLIYNKKDLLKKILDNKTRTFLYLKRNLSNDVANKILDLKIAGVFSEKSYKRFYPEAEASAQVIGFTNVDDRGQEGLELAYDSWLRGIPGKMKVNKDCNGNVVSNLGVITNPKQGKDLVLSIDRRLQYLVYQELKNAVELNNAEYASAIILSVKTGEVLAVSNFPSYNPNDRSGIKSERFRNRALTDLFEPGSTIKPFTIINALNSGKYSSKSLIDTNPGYLKIGGHILRDVGNINNGVLTVSGVLQKSSDVGIAKIALSLPSDSLLELLRDFCFGQSTQSGFPGEASGVLPDNLKARPLVLATFSFGYSLSVTAMQLALGYSIIASHGLLKPITFLKIDKAPEGIRIISSKLCDQLLIMLELVLGKSGTGKLAHLDGYRIGGKTGTAHIASSHGGYYKDRYFATFVGIATISDPRFVVVVVIKNPRGKYYQGSRVASPVFSKIMNATIRVLGILPDEQK